MTKIEIIDETVEFYSKNPRAVESLNTCAYLTADGRKCAHSRCIQDKIVTKEFSNYWHRKSAVAVLKEEDDSIHKEAYQGHSGEFWRDIQKLHDKDYFWSGNKLTEEGKEFVKKLKKIWR